MTEAWELKFDEKFGKKFYLVSDENSFRLGQWKTPEQVKAFIRTAIQQEREKIFNLADGLVLEPNNLRKQIEDYEKPLASLTEEKEGK